MRYPIVCLAAVAIAWVLSGIHPNYRDVWLMESILVVLGVPLLVVLHRRIGLSNAAFTLVTAFLLLHFAGSHYSYSETPAGAWAMDWFGYERNHYDRLVHFSFGLLLALPLTELITRGAKIGIGLACWFTLAIVMAGSTLYELLEWWFLLLTYPEAGIAFLGAQGDVWDAQKDTALASLGAVLSLGAIYLARPRARETGDQSPSPHSCHAAQ